MTETDIKNKLRDSGLDLTALFSAQTIDINFLLYFYRQAELPILFQLAFIPSAFAFGLHYTLLECPCKVRTISLTPYQTYDLDLSSEIGPSGKLLYINYTSQGPIRPVELHGNCPMGHEYILHKQIYALPIDIQQAAAPTEVSVMYAYATADLLQDISLRLFIDAFQHFFLGEYQIMVIKAQTACEYSLTYFLKEEVCPNNRAPYYKKLKTMLPNIIEKKHYPPLDDTISASLDKLRILRNQIVHDGVSPLITQAEATEYLRNAFLLYKYLRIVRQLQTLMNTHEIPLT